jgi:hypothetical protein
VSKVSKDVEAQDVGETHAGIAESSMWVSGTVYEGCLDDVGSLEGLNLVLGGTLGNDGPVAWIGWWDNSGGGSG